MALLVGFTLACLLVTLSFLVGVAVGITFERQPMPDAPKLPPIRPKHTARPRLTTTARGYGWAHQRQRARLIEQHPICQRCGDGWSEHLHHRDRNPHNRADSNVELLCEACHEREHGR